MAIDFPNSPADGEAFSSGATTWLYSSASGKWSIAPPDTPTTTAFAPIGTVINYVGTIAPNGWLSCDGSSLLRSSYPALFGVISTIYGQGSNPGTTFALPQFMGTTGMYMIRATDEAVTLSSASNLLAMPVGTMSIFAMSSIPTGWVRCDGSALSRTTYADLYSAVGTTYGAGDGSTTFNIPNIPGSGTGSPVYYIKAILSGDAAPASVAHASSHIRTGSDIIDGDRVQVDYVPARYTRDSSAAQAGASTDLTAHLKGLDNNFERVRVDANGRVTLPYQPSFKAYNSSGSQINNPTNPTTLVFNDVSYGGGHNVGSHYSTSTGIFTAPIAGRYLFCANMLTNPAFSTNDPGYIWYSINLNGTNIHFMGHSHHQNWVMEGSSIILNMSASDYVSLVLIYGSGHYGAYSYFAGCLLG